MKKSILSFQQFLMLILVVFAFACGDDDEGSGNNQPTTEELLVGTWTTSDVEVNTSVGEQSLAEYLESLGESAEDAATAAALYEALLESEISGSLTFNVDGTYDSFFGGDSDSGTWSLSADETTLTLDEGTIDEVDLTINSITSNTLNVIFGDTISEDLDDDPETPDEEITAEADITLTK